MKKVLCRICDATGEGLGPDSKCWHCHGLGWIEIEPRGEPDREDEDV